MDGDEGAEWTDLLRRIRNDDPNVTFLDIGEIPAIDENYIQDMTDENWEELGRDISNNTHLELVSLTNGALDDHKMSSLFRGLTRSSSIKKLTLFHNEFRAAGVRCMVPFLQNANNLTKLDLDSNNIQSEGFNMLFRALRDSPIEVLDCQSCGIESIEIDSENKPNRLRKLILDYNNINADGYRGLATLLRGENATLTELHLQNNKNLRENMINDDGLEVLTKGIDDDGLEILVGALRSNTSLTCLNLTGNVGISKQGKLMLLKLVNDISSINATLRSNHTLRNIDLDLYTEYDPMQEYILMATMINSNEGSPEEVSRAKVIQTQLDSEFSSCLRKNSWRLECVFTVAR